ncbi:MAG: hypothetical protein RIS54_1314 [Verrucomicrobiota bacterium]|jgi:ADP-heptose:LPS heptosyltransferase
MRQILILRGGALGDFVVTLPALAALRRQWPAAEINLVGNASAAQLALDAGLLARVESQHAAPWHLLYQSAVSPLLKAHLARYDLVLNFWPDSDGAVARHFPASIGQRFLSAEPTPSRAPASSHFSAALQPFALPTVPDWIALRRPTPSLGLVVIHPGSGSSRKNWPLANWLKIARTLTQAARQRVVFILGEAEASLDIPRDFPRWQNLPLRKLADRLSTCDLFLGHDSGVGHLAGACAARGLILFGPTGPMIWAPPNPAFAVLRAKSGLPSLTVAEVQARVTAMLEDQR